ncbi:MAG TPA: VWA domain-containing protein, partial [Pirellulales bacterium]|nr:VWA domain-containing protein [Pirellulales bacterium]
RRKTSAGGSGKGQGNGRSGGKGAGAGGKPGYAAGSGFFGLPTAAGKVVFIVDISGSMHGRRIRRAQTELRHTLESLKPSQKFFVVFFSDGATAMPAEGLLSATRDNIIQAWQWIRQAECGGGTNPLPAVLMALELKPDAIYLLTDGKFEPQVYFAATEAPPGARTPINTIGFATKKAERLLQAIANETGGSYRFVP